MGGAPSSLHSVQSACRAQRTRDTQRAYWPGLGLINATRETQLGTVGSRPLDVTNLRRQLTGPISPHSCLYLSLKDSVILESPVQKPTETGAQGPARALGLPSPRGGPPLLHLRDTGTSQQDPETCGMLGLGRGSRDPPPGLAGISLACG